MANTADQAWRGFRGTGWQQDIDVSGFIRDNVEAYLGGAEFLAGPTHRTERIWRELTRMFAEERRRGIYDVDTHTPSTITAHEPHVPWAHPRLTAVRPRFSRKAASNVVPGLARNSASVPLTVRFTMVEATLLLPFPHRYR